MALDYELRNGDVVSIQTAPPGPGEDPRPQPEWLRFAKSRSTRAKLRAHFRTRQVSFFILFLLEVHVHWCIHHCNYNTLKYATVVYVVHTPEWLRFAKSRSLGARLRAHFRTRQVRMATMYLKCTC
jgi:hypothetical protein